ncbi:MAG TPA: response regulator [Edaphobacter sp.]|nr:response regulator [Edaphobacter sp.]
MNVQPRTIAVIDDDRRVLESLVNLLASFGYKADSYISAEQFLGSGTLSRTSCIITDIEMRQMNGLALLQYVKNSNSAVPVIIITGKPSETSSFYLERGAIGFFRKPVDGDVLLELVSSVCT